MILKDCFQILFWEWCIEPPKNQINFEHFGSSSFPSSQGHNLGNFGQKSKSRISMEGQDQYQAACMNRKGLIDFKCPKKVIEQKVRVYTSPTVASYPYLLVASYFYLLVASYPFLLLVSYPYLLVASYLYLLVAS